MDHSIVSDARLKEIDELAVVLLDGSVRNSREALTSVELRDICKELAYRHDQARKDSRRAGQLKKLRWSVETLLMKVEALDRQDDTKEKENPGG